MTRQDIMTELPTKPATVDEARRKLLEPFAPWFLKWKPANFKSSPGKLKLLPYLDARAVMDRLDEVFGPDGWQTAYRQLSTAADTGPTECTIRVLFPQAKDWISKADVGSRTENMPEEDDNVKSAYSDALKRAAVHLGIGRYLYRMGQLEGEWDGRRVTKTPEIPQRYLPLEHRHAGAEYADRAIQLVTVYCQRANAPVAQYISGYFRSINLDEPSPLAKAEHRHITGLMKKANADFQRLAGKPEQPTTAPQADQPSPQPPAALPTDGKEFHQRIKNLDATLQAEGTTETGELLGHLTSAGVKAGYSADLSTWTSPAIQFAAEVVKEFVSRKKAQKKSGQSGKHKPAGNPVVGAA